MDDIAAFARLPAGHDGHAGHKFGWGKSGGFTSRRAESNRDPKQGGGQSWTGGPGSGRYPRIRGGKVPFVFRTLPGYTFLRQPNRAESGRPEAPTLPAGFAIVPETRSGRRDGSASPAPDDDEELEFFGFAGPES